MKVIDAIDNGNDVNEHFEGKTPINILIDEMLRPTFFKKTNFQINASRSLKLLLQSGVNVEIQDADGNTPFHCLAYRWLDGTELAENRFQVMKILAAYYNGDLSDVINTQNKNGHTVFDYAINAFFSRLEWGTNNARDDAKTVMFFWEMMDERTKYEFLERLSYHTEKARESDKPITFNPLIDRLTNEERMVPDAWF
jgi:hypothetical protein